MKGRFLEVCRWLTWGSWGFGRGIDIDHDGEIDGSGWMLRIEPPRWLRRWAGRRVLAIVGPPPPSLRADISDVIMASLLTGVRPEVLERVALGYAPGVAPEITWVEDRLNPRPWRP